ncbi:MAG: sigma-70 family RNA polymerase sigma factor [Bacteroidota bacterium]
MSSVDDFKKNPEKELQKLYSLAKQKCITILIKKFPILASDAEEIFQEGMTILWEKIEKNEFTEGKLEPYLMGIMKNLGHTRNRQYKKDQNFKQKKSIDRILYSENPLTAYNEERISLVNQALNKMGDPCKKLLDLYFNKQKSTEEIIKIMEYKNANTLKSKKYKCIKRLQNLVKDISNCK